MTGILLDTCAVLWIAGDDRLSADALRIIDAAAAAQQVFVSPVSIWEIGTLSRPRAGKAPRFNPYQGLRPWVTALLVRPGFQNAPFTAATAVEAALLPPGLHEDPGDRLLVATARILAMPIVTRDRKILDYAALGHVQAIAC